MQTVTTSISIGWLNLDFWSEMYVGTRWLVVDELPRQQWQAAPRHGPLSQMALLSSHHLVEAMLFHCIKKTLYKSPGKHPEIEKKFHKAMFQDAFYKWPSKLLSIGFDLESEPFKSAKRLHERRNATIHKESALTSLEMARSALFTAVEASRSISHHMLGSDGFRYDSVLKKYPINQEPWFSEIKFIERRRA